jgi:3D (Asp-Asp-Asp) domain-containing protein
VSRIAKAAAIFVGLCALQATSWLGIGPLARQAAAPTPPAAFPSVASLALAVPGDPAPTQAGAPLRVGSARASRSDRGTATRSLGIFKITCYVLRGTTKSGVPAGPRVAAVDPKVIRLGSWIDVDGIGRRLAADTGRLVRGRHVDVWMSSYADCIDFGVRRRAVSLEATAP